MNKQVAFLAVLLSVLLGLAGCSVVKPSYHLKVDSNELQFVKPVAGDTIATIKTNKGEIKVLLFPKQAPKAVENFISHAKNGYYDGITFHRAIENFVVQSGSPDGQPNGGSSIWGLPFEDEFTDLLHHYTGALSMANSGPNTNQSQFFFVTSEIGKLSPEQLQAMSDAGWRQEVVQAYKEAGGIPSLDYRNTVFGQIYEGLDVVFEISKAKTDDNDKPKKDIIIDSIEISQVE